MIITSKRYKFGEDFTLSRLAIDGIQFDPCGYVLEDKVREVFGMPVEKWKIPSETAIPVGRYVVKKTMSNRFGKLMWQLMDVPGYEGVRIHSGNTSHDTEGCLIVGKERNEKEGEVSGSRIGLAALDMRLDNAWTHGEPIFWIVDGLP
jgi:hypothetical protein